MTPDTLFLLFNGLAFGAWILLLAAPFARITHTIVHSVVPGVFFGVFYTWFLLNGGLEGPEGAGFSSLEGVMLFFTSKEAVLAGWIHYLVFDLFLGAWIIRDGTRHGISRWVCLPCQIFTLLSGPFGFLLYMMVRTLRTKQLSIEETA